MHIADSLKATILQYKLIIYISNVLYKQIYMLYKQIYKLIYIYTYIYIYKQKIF